MSSGYRHLVGFELLRKPAQSQYRAQSFRRVTRRDSARQLIVVQAVSLN